MSTFRAAGASLRRRALTLVILPLWLLFKFGVLAALYAIIVYVLAIVAVIWAISEVVP